MADRGKSISDVTAHALSPQEVLSRMRVDFERGLSESEAESRVRQFGPNRLARTRTRSALSVFIDQFKSVVLILLAVAAVIAFVFGQVPEGIAIVVVLGINAIIGFACEWRAQRSMDALRRMGTSTVRVLRQGSQRQISVESLVPGDIVFLEGGAVVPADIRLIEATGLGVDESALTGESVSVNKQLEPVGAETPLHDRRCMLYKGTVISEGSAEGVVVATGMQTELGRIARMTGEAEEEVTPLEKKLERLGRRLVWVTLAVTGFVAAGGLLAGQPVLTMVETAIALGVAAVPEGLPIVATIALARGMWMLAKRHALINRLTAVETLGATAVIFTDKTGTLTENRMHLQNIATALDEYELGEQTKPEVNFERDSSLGKIIETVVLCSNASLADGGQGDPTEVALLRAGEDFDIRRDELLEQKPEAREVSFDPDRMMMATFHEMSGGFYVAVKGAPSAVLDVCSSIVSDNEQIELGEQEKADWLRKADEFASEGLRVLAVACKQVEESGREPYQNLRLLGLVGLADPPRQGVAEAVAACRQAQIRPVLVTGDKPETARAIARQVGLAEDDAAVMLGRELPNGEDIPEQAGEKILRTIIFARVSPAQKLGLLTVFQQHGYVVAMTGDGINDMPALKKADIGVAMGLRGTDAARQVADMILKDDAFSSIVAAVRQGRVIFKNIRKSVMFMLCTNVAEVLAVAAASFAAAPLPLLPLQILYLNVLTDVFPALALGAGKGDPYVMHKPPRKSNEPVLTHRHWLGVGLGSVPVAGCVLAGLAIALLALGFEQRAAVTVSFLTLGFSKLWFVFNLRDVGSGFVRNDVFENPWVWAAIAGCAALLVASVYTPGLSGLLKTSPLPGRGWALVLGLSVVPAVLGQLWLGLRGWKQSTGRR